MTTPNHSSVYALAEPAAVDVSAIEQELEKLWRGASGKDEHDAVLHAASFNLIYAVRAEADHGDTEAMLASLVLSDPSRAILLRLGDEAVPASQQAWVTAYCHRPSAHSPQVCSEFIHLEITGDNPASVVSTLLSLRLSGLPTILIWDSSLPPDHSLLEALGGECDRIITAIIPPFSPASSLSTFFDLQERLGKRVLATDLLESLIRPWQSAVAALFDRNPGAAENIREVHLHYDDLKIPADALMMAAWVAAALRWKDEKFTLHGSQPVMTFSEENTIAFHGESPNNKDHAIEFIIGNGNDTMTLRCEDPGGDNPVADLLKKQLQIWNSDARREAMLANARRWLKELLFA